MQSKSAILTGRLLEFAAGTIRLSTRLARTVPGRYICSQLMRAACSTGANYQEACAAESRADFVHKLQVVLKELRESSYRLQLAVKSNLTPETDIVPLTKELDELTRIIAKSVLTAKSGVKST